MNIEYLIGAPSIKRYSRIPFDKIICEFLDDFSVNLNSFKKIKKYPDLKTLAIWCRKNNIDRLKNHFQSSNYRFGLGLIFHIIPSNIPINFAFSENLILRCL